MPVLYEPHMPTLEFHGYSSEAATRFAARAKTLLTGLSFCDDIVFVMQGPTQVIAWDGTERPFVRVLTRRQERADQIKERLTKECDLEVVLIDFIPRANG